MSEDKISSLSEKYSDKKEEAPKTNTKDNVLSNENKEALEMARESRNEKREQYITHITANSSMCADNLKKMDSNTLKDIASGIHPEANFSGRPFATPQSNSVKNSEEAIKAMSTPSTSEFIQNKNKEVN